MSVSVSSHPSAFASTVRLPSSKLALATTLLLALSAYGILARSCEYHHEVILRYFGYLALFVWLPGSVTLLALSRRRFSIVESFAVGLPLGFALEIFSFIACSATDARFLYPWLPLGWLLALGVVWRRQRTDNAAKLSRRSYAFDPWLLCALAALFLVLMIAAAGHLFAPSPLSNGRLTEVTHQDWVYLVSRAAEIKLRWPWQDPSLAGSPLSYHYFLMVHIAAASLTTGDEIATLLLRLCVVPLSAALLSQTFVLGRAVSKHSWGGVLAGALLLLCEEVSFQPLNEAGSFLNLFTHWLYISPTFFFGVIFMAPLLIWVHRLVTDEAIRWTDLLILLLLSAAATGAKGTSTPPVIAALAAWIVLETIKRRALPGRMILVAAVMTTGFAIVYTSVLLDWGTGAAAFAPFVSMRISQFWLQHADLWKIALQNVGFSPAFASALSIFVCCVVVLVGYHGVKLIALPYFFLRKRQQAPTWVVWLGLVWAVSYTSGQFISLDSNSQLYLLFPASLPIACLAAAALISLWPTWVRKIQTFESNGYAYLRIVFLGLAGAFAVVLAANDYVSWPTGLVSVVAIALIVGPGPRAASVIRGHGKEWRRFVLLAAPYVATALLLLVQVNHWRLRNREGIRLWFHNSATGADKDLASLGEGLQWMRVHTPADAIIVANAFTSRNLSGHGAAQLDRTTVDKYYYYSALAERRLWVEGPTYVRNQLKAEIRIQKSDAIFYHGGVNRVLADAPGRYYLLIDRSLLDGAKTNQADAACVFSNDRVSIYRVRDSTRPINGENVASLN